MIIPKHHEEALAKNPDLSALVKSFPQAFFGYWIKYPKQSEIIRKWLEVRPKICVISGWKRTGKTHIPAYLAACWITGLLDPNWPGAKSMGIKDTYHWKRKFNGERVGIIAGSSLDHVENVLLKMYQDLIPPSRIKNWFSKTNKKIELTDKSKFIVRTYEQGIEEWKSGNSQFTHLDEEAPWEVMNEVIARSMSLDGKIFITVALDDADVSWLPEACANPMKVFGTDSFLHFKLGLEDVPDEIVPPTAKAMEFARYDNTPLRSAVRNGEWAHLSGRWWNHFDANVHVIEPFKIPDHWLRWRAMDAGIAAPTACLWAAMHPCGDIFIYREYYKAGTTIDDRCRDVIEMSGNYRQRDGEMWVENQVREKYVLTLLDHHEFKLDAATGDSVDYHYIKSGLICSPSTSLGQEARREMANTWLQLDMNRNHFISHKPGAPRVYIFNTCVNLIFEAQTKAVKREKNSRSGISEKKIMHRGDHATDCFSSGTLITTMNGDVPIEKVKEGDMVLTRQGYFPVLWSRMTRVCEVMDLKLSNGRYLIGTPNHNIWVKYHGWKEMKNLTNKDVLITQNSSVTIESIVPCGTIEVYNLTIDKVHEYFANGVLVKNCGEYLFSELEYWRETVPKRNRSKHSGVWDDDDD